MVERLGWIALALIHASPAAALFVPGLITRLYGIAPSDPAFALLHHRAALFAVIVLICLWAAIDATMSRLACAALALSMLSFLAIWWANGAPASLRTIAIADLVGLPILAWLAWRAYFT